MSDELSRVKNLLAVLSVFIVVWVAFYVVMVRDVCSKFELLEFEVRELELLLKGKVE